MTLRGPGHCMLDPFTKEDSAMAYKVCRSRFGGAFASDEPGTDITQTVVLSGLEPTIATETIQLGSPECEFGIGRLNHLRAV